jgi:endonuclease/exonuclease/phosphatase family metal-dependent hydrolase
MRILTWNVACLPNKINFLRNPNTKINQIIDKMIMYSPDVICLQEVFDYKLQKKIKEGLGYFDYQTHHSPQEGFISKNGLLTATIPNINNTMEIDYSMYTGIEYLIKKGLLTTQIEYQNKDFFIHNTHLQSNSVYHLQNICGRVRQKQKKEVIEYLEKYKNKNNILCGDLNDDFLKLEHQNFLSQLPFPNYLSNQEKIMTFPKYQQQLDYIIMSDTTTNSNYFKLDVEKEKLSDHDILILDYTI